MVNYMIDLFAGAGGLSKGLEMAGFKSVLGVDNDRAATETYQANHQQAKVFVGNIRDLEVELIRKLIKGKKIKLVCGGPPCQGFSTVGRNNPDDQRNHLFLEFVRIVKEIKPDYILVENVTGLMSKKNENTLKSIMECFSGLGYTLDIKVLSSHHYGVPEIRRRTIILGNKFGIKNVFPAAKYADPDDSSTNLPRPNNLKWAFKNLIYFKGKRAYNHDLKLAIIKNDLERKRIKQIPEGKGVRYQIDEKKYLPKNLRFKIDWAKISEGRFRQTKLKRLKLAAPAPTINTFITTYYHPTENRYLTPREAAAIQSFPADFKFFGSLSQQWRQIGNAVPPLMAKEIGLSILKLDREKHLAEKHNGFVDVSKIRSSAFRYKKKKTILPEEKQPSLYL